MHNNNYSNVKHVPHFKYTEVVDGLLRDQVKKKNACHRQDLDPPRTRPGPAPDQSWTCAGPGPDQPQVKF